MNDMSSLSIIICTLDRPILLARCLESLLMQLPGKPAVEAIIVDGSTTDGTRKLVAEYSRESPIFQYFFEKKKGHSAARNRGYFEARGEYLVYLDDDVVLPADYMENVIRVIHQYSPDILGGPVYPYYTSPKPWWFSDEFEIRRYEEKSGFSSTCGISGGNFIIRKAVLETLDLFDPSYGMAGDVLGMLDERKVVETYRVRRPLQEQKIYYSLECYVYHHAPMEKMHIAYMLRRAFVAGEAQFRMYLDIKGVPNYDGVRAYFKKIIWSFFYETPRHLLKRGFRDKKFVTSFIKGLIVTSKGMGYVRGLVQYLMSRRGIQGDRMP